MHALQQSAAVRVGAYLPIVPWVLTKPEAPQRYSIGYLSTIMRVELCACELNY